MFLNFIFHKLRKKNVDNKISIINIGRNDNNIKIIDVAKIIQELIPGTKIKFLNKSKENQKEQLFTDRKIKEGHDSRTYKVLFDQLENTYGFKCKYSVKDGIFEMIENFTKFKFDDKIFKFKGFYR